ncbi:MAG: toll/interleukin-1 receptor domain-containing protein [Phycisphaerales bacterium]|nr:toll/interleukin-1 receptor domain-containing protein [Phycisphaerales bacterium]
MHDVFISHSSKDKALADRLVSGLEAGGVRCWIAPRDIPRGEAWAAQIVRAIEGTPIFLLVFTSHSNESDQVIREVTLAVESRSHVIPVRFDAVPFSSNLKYFLSLTQWYDASQDFQQDQLGDLVARLRGVLANTKGGDAGPAATVYRSARSLSRDSGRDAEALRGGEGSPSTPSTTPANSTPTQRLSHRRLKKIQPPIKRFPYAFAFLLLSIALAATAVAYKILTSPKPHQEPRFAQAPAETLPTNDPGTTTHTEPKPEPKPQPEPKAPDRLQDTPQESPQKQDQPKDQPQHKPEDPKQPPPDSPPRRRPDPSTTITPDRTNPGSRDLSPAQLADLNTLLDGYARRPLMVFAHTPLRNPTLADVSRLDSRILERRDSSLVFGSTTNPERFIITPAGSLLFRGIGLPTTASDDAIHFSRLTERDTVIMAKRNLISQGTDVWRGERSDGGVIYLAILPTGVSPANRTTTISEPRRIPAAAIPEIIPFDAVMSDSLGIPIPRMREGTKLTIDGAAFLQEIAVKEGLKSSVALVADAYDDQKKPTMERRILDKLDPKNPTTAFSFEVPTGTTSITLSMLSNPGKFATPIWAGVRITIARDRTAPTTPTRDLTVTPDRRPAR